MIKSNCKKALDKIRGYIMENYNFEGYDDAPQKKDYHNVCCFIYNTFVKEKEHNLSTGNYQSVFTEWCAGLPSILNTDYYYNVSSIDLVGDILEQTSEERHKYDEQTAKDYMSYLLYREISKEARKGM